MNSQKQKIVSLLFLIGVISSSQIWNEPKGKWNYNLAGSDWPGNKVLYVNQCGSPLAQSPINIPDEKITKTNDVRLTVQWVARKQEVDITFKKGAFRSEGIFSILRMKAGVLDIDYYSTYMELHAPGENELHGEFYDLELQIYHRLYNKHQTRTKYKEAVVSILFRKSYEQAKNPFFQQWDFSKIQYDPKDLGKANGRVTVNIGSLSKQLEDNSDFYNFFGSYTQPPCTENMNWFVFDQVLEVNVDQLKEINKFFRFNEDFAGGRGNAREIQNLGNRKITKGGAVFTYPVDIQVQENPVQEEEDKVNTDQSTLVSSNVVKTEKQLKKKSVLSKKQSAKSAKEQNIY